MLSHLMRLIASAALLGALVPAARADKLTKVEIVKRGKAATALVEPRPGGGSGTAFCIHPSGLFVTNEHVVRSAGDRPVRLVLSSGLKTERVFEARIVRADRDLDLALLAINASTDLPSLPLGSAEVTELMNVITFGFPFGRGLSPERNKHPAVSVNIGHVNALRRKEGELHRIELDVTLNPGHSGAPVLDERGKVVGVVVAGLRRARINQAIPVSHLEQFLATPIFRFTPPELTSESAGKPAPFSVRVVSVPPSARPPDVRLLLKVGEGGPREVAMTGKGDLFVASAIPLPPGPRWLELNVRFEGGAVTGPALDRVFKMGDQPVRLSELSRLTLGPKPLAVRADGKTTLEGRVSGLDKVEVLLGGRPLALPLDRAESLHPLVLPPPGSVHCTFVASRAGKEIGRFSESVLIRRTGHGDPGPRPAVVIRPPALDEEKVVKSLPAAFADVAVGGGGRYLIFHLPRLRKLAVFDVNEARVTRYVPAAEDKVLFAAGMDKLVVGLPKKGELQRWSLTTFERELTALPDFKGDIASVIMGASSNGPVVVNGVFLDLRTLKRLPLKYPGGGSGTWGTATRILPSGDGTVYGAWNTNYSPGTSSTFVLEGEEVKRYEEGEVGHVVPGPDGRVVYTARGPLSGLLKRGKADDAKLGYTLPATEGSYFMALTPAVGGKGGGLTIHLPGQLRPIAKLNELDHGLSFDGWDRSESGVWKRIFLVPRANLIVVLPPSNDRVVLHKFDVESALEKSGIDYLVITSRPPATAKRGAELSYQVQVKVKKGPAKFQLDSGPAGMTVSPTGLVKWAVPARGEDENEVILTIRDGAGQEVFHTFTLRAVKE